MGARNGYADRAKRSLVEKGADRMKRLRSSRPPAGLVVAIIALVAALGGGAVAQVATTASLTKLERKQVRRIATKIANQQITKRAPGGLVITRVNSNPLPDGMQAVVDATCATGERMLGGGASGVAIGTPLGPEPPQLVTSRPLGVGGGIPPNGTPLTAWRVGAHNPVGGVLDTTVYAYAVCLRPG
jgi:hypothetical protein